MAEAIDVLKQQGAVIVDPADIPSVVATDATKNFLLWSTCGGLDNAKGKDADCSVVFKYGMKRDFNAWLASLGAAAPVKTLTELRQWNVAHQRAGAIKYGQALLDISDEMDVGADRARYEADRDKDIRLSATDGIDAAMKANQLDALLFPGTSSASIAAQAGLSDGHRARSRVVAARRRQAGARRAPASGASRLPRGLQPEAVARRRELHRDGVQRAEAHRDRLRVRAGDEEARAARGYRPISRLTAANASSAISSSARVWAAEICVRMRASPFGTTGYENPIT